MSVWSRRSGLRKSAVAERRRRALHPLVRHRGTYCCCYSRGVAGKGDGMKTLAEVCGPAVDFSYRSIDLVLNDYIPTLQTPAAMAQFFRALAVAFP